MAEMHELHRRAGETLKGVLAEAREERLVRATPCEAWNVRDLLHHIAWSNLWVAPLLRGESLAEVGSVLGGDVLGGDPAGVTGRSVDESSDAFAEPGAMERLVELSRGPTPGREYAAERMNDLTVHAWDLAKGLGTEVALDPLCVQASLDYYRPLEAILRPAGEMGPDVEVSGEADPQTRFLAFWGRRADWTPPA